MAGTDRVAKAGNQNGVQAASTNPKGEARWNRGVDSVTQQRQVRLIRSAVGAFFGQDLLAAGRQLLDKAEGSFGLVLSTALDASSELVIAARGQTMSVAFYPRLGLFTFGSESSATKAGLGKRVDGASSDTQNELLHGAEVPPQGLEPRSLLPACCC